MSKISALGRSAIQIGGAILATSGVLDATTSATLATASANGHIGTASAIQIGLGALGAIIGALLAQKKAAKTENQVAALSAVGIDPATAAKDPDTAVITALNDKSTLVNRPKV